MASALRKSFIGLVSRYTTNSPTYVRSGCTKLTLAPHIATRGLCGLTLTRTVACNSALQATQSKNCGVTHRSNTLCGCRSYHSEGDQKISSFLKEEISNETKGVKNKVTQIDGWTSSKDGTKVSLTKNFHDEKIKVTFDVNNSVDVDTFEEDGASTELPPMVSRPNFEVEMKKSSGKMLKMYCEFEYDDQGLEAAPEEDDQIRDQFNIIDVRLGNATENNYTLQSSVMDADMYEYLMDMLDERGVDDIFITNMVEFSTTYEHDLYIDFLSDLKDFMEDK